jgi:hypothetical protein
MDVPTSVRSGQLPGPWRDAFFVDLPLQARSKSNFRRHRTGDGHWDALAGFESDVAALVAPQVPSDWDPGRPDDPIARRPAFVALVAARTLLDVSNLSKSVLDALEGIVYVTDAQVVAETSLSERGRSDQWLSVAFARLDRPRTLLEVTAAASALVTAWGARGR